MRIFNERKIAHELSFWAKLWSGLFNKRNFENRDGSTYVTENKEFFSGIT
jgi:hypothetical protein